MQRTLFMKRYGTARARRDDPVQSHAAADRMNRSGQPQYERIQVLKALRLHGVSTAKFLDRVMPTAIPAWDGWAHRRMKELDDMGFVCRSKLGREMVCSITERGKEVLKG